MSGSTVAIIHARNERLKREQIEQDAVANTPAMSDVHPISDPHTHEIKSFIATPRTDQGFVSKIISWFKSDLKPGLHVVHKDNDPLRYMFIVTSNSYQDREDETITTSALKAYEDSCFPTDDGQFACDNPLLWWHDDDVPMGEIVAVNLSGPFLVEVARELPTRVSKVLWDFAEQNGDKAGASHRFGYLEKDRDPDGTFHRIYKQETTYLPERDLAANERTYAGVMSMASAQSDKRLDEIFEKVAGIKNASAKLHAKSGELEQELAAAGIQHKAQKPPMPPKADMPMPNPEAVAEAEADEEVEEDAKEGRAADMTTYLAVIEQITSLVMDLVDAQAGLNTRQMSLEKSLDELKEGRVSEKSTEQKAQESIETRLKAIEGSIATLKAQLAMTPRSVSQSVGKDPDLTKQEIAEAIDKAEKARKEEKKTFDSFWGELGELPK